MSARRGAQSLVAICTLIASFSATATAQTTPEASTTASTAPLPGAHPTFAAPTTVVSGPLDAERKLLLSRIELAKKHGIGTSVYYSEFNKIEEEVKAGATADQVKGRIESLTRSLAEQLQRGRNLKTQRPIPPAGSQSGGNDGGGPVAASSPRSSGGGGGGGSLAEKLKSITNDLPPGTLEKIMQNDKARNLLERLK